MTDTEFRFVYVTAPSREVALKIARGVVDKRLAACANVLSGMTSVYWWNGKLNEDSEVVLVLKTHASRLPALTDAIKAHHPYDCPCIVAWPITAGNPDYLQWLAQETGVSPAR